MRKAYDTIIIGGGHNGLVAANYLAKANKKTLVLQQRHVVGGAALTQELIPGFKFSRCSYVLSLFRKQIIQQLNLFQKGLKIYYRDISSLTPTREVGKYLLFHSNPNITYQQIAKFSEKDAIRWSSYEKYLQQICDFWEKNLDHLPLNYKKNPSLLEKIKFYSRFIKPNFDYFDFSQFITSSVQEMLDSWFESDILKATLATDGIIGENLSVSHHSTAYVLLHHVMGQLQQGRKGQWGYVQGGNGKLSQILAQSAKDFGAQIRLNSPVQQILFDGNQAIGVKMKNGEKIYAKAVLSNCTNRVTFQQLIPHPEKILKKELLNKIKKTEYNGAATKINIALKKLPKFKSFKDHALTLDQLLQGTIHINCQNMEQLNRSYNQTKKNRISQSPFMDITIPSIFDKTLCPQGYYIMNCFLQYTPYIPNNGNQPSPISHDQIKRVFLQTINEYLEQPLDIHYMDILTPYDLENMLGLTEGNIFHGSIGLLSGNVGGVWLCGSSAHPGGGVMGAVGRQVSQEIINSKVI